MTANVWLILLIVGVAAVVVILLDAISTPAEPLDDDESEEHS